MTGSSRSTETALGRDLPVLALLAEPETVRATLQCAVSARLPLGRRVRAVCVGYDPDHVYASSEERDMDLLRETSEGTAAQRIAKMRAAFDGWLTDSGASGQVGWEICQGDVEVCVTSLEASADLLVIGAPHEIEAKVALHAALFKAHRLVLVAPRTSASLPNGIGKQMVIGWKAGGNVEHAVTAALPWLANSEGVTVVSVDDGRGPGDLNSARELLLRLGVAADGRTVDSDGQLVADVLIAEAARVGADSIIVGAFRHGEFWEDLVGGVSKALLSRCPFPMFMMH